MEPFIHIHSLILLLLKIKSQTFVKTIKVPTLFAYNIWSPPSLNELTTRKSLMKELQRVLKLAVCSYVKLRHIEIKD